MVIVYTFQSPKRIYTFTANIGIVTHLTRVGLLVYAQKVTLPNLVYRSLKYIPVAILTALIVPGILIPHGKLDLSPLNPYLGAGIITAGIVLATKNSILSILLGIVSLIFLKTLL